MNALPTLGRAVLFGTLLVGIAACGDQEGLTRPGQNATTNNSAESQQERKFYLHERDRIYLDVDASSIIVSSRSADVDKIVAAAFADDPQVRVGASYPLSVAGHHVYALAGATAAAVARAREALIRDSRVEFASPAYRTLEGRHPILPVNQLDIRFAPTTTDQEVEETIRSVGARIIRTPQPDSGYFAYRAAYDVTSDPLDVALTLAGRATVQWADPDKVTNFAPSYTPTDPFYSQQFFLSNTNALNGVNVDINVSAAWIMTLGSSAIRVAVIDDGVDVLHSNSGGGFAGDLVGRFGGTFAFDEMSALATGDNQHYPHGNDTHGTSVAGIIAASHNNGVGGAGIAPNTLINTVRIFRRSYPDGSGLPTQSASTAQVGDALNKAWQTMQSDVINNSWGGGAPATAITNAIDNALSLGRGGKGSVMVFAAGNPSARSFGIINAVVYPAWLSSSRNVISVSAINQFGGVADYSPDGMIDVVALSGHTTNLCVGEVVTIDRYASAGCSDGPGGAIDFTSSFSGTSAAAPQVSGVAALMLARYPALTAAQVKTRIRTSAVPWGSSTTFGTGKLDAFWAIW